MKAGKIGSDVPYRWAAGAYQEVMVKREYGSACMKVQRTCMHVMIDPGAYCHLLTGVCKEGVLECPKEAAAQKGHFGHFRPTLL